METEEVPEEVVEVQGTPNYVSEQYEMTSTTPNREESVRARSRSSSVPAENMEVEGTEDMQLKHSRNLEDSFESPEGESARSKLINDALQQEDEFLEYLMSLPPTSSAEKEKQKPPEIQTPTQLSLMRSISTYDTGNVSSGAKVGLDHLDNLCKLMEQLGDLREQNSKLQRRVQYLEDLKNLQEMHKELQEDSKRRELQEVAFLRTLQQHRQFSAKRHQHRRIIEEIFPTRPIVTKREGSQDSITSANKRSSKCKSMANGKFRQSLLRYPARERSRSVGVEEIKPEQLMEDRNGRKKIEESKQGNKSKQQRRSVVGITSGSKAKVSKWTKVKEAFRWEKASVVILPEAKSQDSGIGGINNAGSGSGACQGCSTDDTRYLRVPSGESKSGDLLSVSPVDSVLSGLSSSACSSGGQSPGYLPCQHPLSDFSLPPTTVLSSSSSSEDLDLDLNFSEILAEYGPQRSASATDSTGGRLEVRRRSLPQMPEDEDASRRSKSLDGDATIGNSALIARHLASKDGTNTGAGKLSHEKSHKTPWGKVKDIIQTRKSSLKKRQRHGKTETKSTSDHEDDGTCEVSTRDSPDKEADPGAKVSKIRTEASSEGTKTLISKKQHQQHVKTSSASLESHANACDSPTSRRLTPVLTVTLPSTEELRHVPPIDRKPPPSPQSEDRLHKISSSSAPPSCDQPASPDDSSKCDLYKRQVSLTRPPSSSAGTSPPVHRRASKWTKVKKAFLTSSSAPGRREEEGAGRSNSVPSSPNRNSSFFDEVDTDELSSGEYGEIVSKNKHEDTYIDNTVVHKETSVHSTSIHAEIQKNYEELQQKLSQEFHKKLHEWERMKASSTSSSSCRGPAGDDGYHDKGFRRKMEEWERKHPQQNQGSNSKHRDSVAFQQLDEDNLSPDFRKKLQEWQRIKKTIPVDASGSAVPPQFRKKIAEWQLWRSGKTDGQHEWDRVKAASSSPSPETVTTQADGIERAAGTKTPSPSIVRKDSTGHSKGGSKKTGSGKCVEKYACKPQQKKEKEQLQWLEKELHKIEREKQRLEREREKYLEREARLEKMRRAMGSGQSKQEVLIQTSTGFFRFQGISEKFTKRLYEWEKARGIGPEASTFALLDPGYRPAGEGATSSHGGDNGDGSLLARSKSASSVSNLGTAVTNVGTSSLSLNDVEVLEQAETAALEDSRAASEPHLRTTDAPEDDEPAAVIVDIEDVIEETAAPLPLTPVVQSETPVYSYAPEEVTRLIDSSGSDSDRDSSKLVQRNDSVRTESSYKLLEENMSLLNKLKFKEDICRKLETEIENLEGKIVDVAKTHKKELQRLRREETEVHSEGEQMCEEVDEGHDNQIEVLRARIRELERRQERLLREGETLQDSFAQHSEQQAALAQNLVGKMKQLQEANINIASCEQADPLPQIHQQVDVVSLVQDLSTQLLSLAEKLEVALADRSREVHHLRIELNERRRTQHKLKLGQHWFSEEGMSLSMGSLAEPEVNSEKGVHTSILPRQSSEELSQLPSLLTNKVLELKEGLNYLCAASGAVALEQSKEMEAANEQVEEDIEPSTTYVLKFARKSDVDDNNEKEQAPKSGDQFPTVVQVDSEGNASPLTCVTITPAFWKRRDTQECDQTSVLKPPESTLNREESSTCIRDSFCSAVSSASATSSVCDDEEEEEEEEEEEVEKDLDSYASDTEPQTSFPSLPKQIINDSTSKKDVSESSVIESEQEKNTDLEDDDDEDDEDDEGKNVGFKYKKAVSGAESYETEVQTYQGKGNGKQRKLLKTRRISDTHIRYRRSSDQKSSSITDSVRNNYESSNYANENEIEHNSMTMDNKQKRACHQPLEKSETEDCLVDNEIRQKRLLPADPHLPFSEGYSSIETDTAPCSSYSAHNKTFPSNSLPTPDNVFVKTTRKIFSPVRRDSKGKASSVISYVVSETTLSSGAEMQQYVQGNDLSTPLISPVVNVIKQEEREDTPINQSPGKTIGNMSPPAWMFTRKRSQSSSPALTRRKSSFANKSSSETISASDSNSDQSKTSTDSNSREELNKNRTPNVERKFNINTLKELELYEEKTVDELRNAAAKDSKFIEGKTLNLSMEQELKGGTSGENKTDKCESSLPPSRPITPSASFPPLPQSPNPNRRDLFKVMNKETAPSIRMMIAKYNQKLTEQDGPGGRSPEISGSGSASPVAWRSPVAERRVRAQMEKYQEEVRRVLEQDGKKLIRYGGSEVKKSASAGVIRAPESPSILKQYSDSVKNGIDAVTNKPPSILTKPRGILKSSSVGAIKTSPSVSQNIPSSNTVETVKETILEQDLSLPSTASITKPPSPRLATSPGPSSPSSPELGHHGSPPPSRLRALRLKKAKEEFLTRGPGGQSWTSEAGTPSTDTPSASVSPDPFWGQPSSPECDKEIRPILRVKQSESANTSRLSQISVGSESSFDGSIAITGKTTVQSEDEGMLLVKSASAGMINVDESTYRKFYVESGTSDQPNASDIQENKTKSQPCGKFGISSITSRFRKVKMRKKDKEGGKMNAVSTLCRQSLLVDLHLSKGGTSRTGGGTEAPGPSTSKSCPSSPVLQRSSSGEKPGSGSSSAHTSWIFNPARKIFKPK